MHGKCKIQKPKNIVLILRHPRFELCSWKCKINLWVAKFVSTHKAKMILSCRLSTFESLFLLISSTKNTWLNMRIHEKDELFSKCILLFKHYSNCLSVYLKSSKLMDPKMHFWMPMCRLFGIVLLYSREHISFDWWCESFNDKKVLHLSLPNSQSLECICLINEENVIV